MPAEAVILEGASLIDGGGGPVINDAMVVIDGARIPYAGPRILRFENTPANRRKLSSKTSIPGLIEAHTHAAFEADMRAYIKNGITTVRFAGLDPAIEARLRNKIASGGLPAPRILSCGPMIDQPPIRSGLSRSTHRSMRPEWQSVSLPSMTCTRSSSPSALLNRLCEQSSMSPIATGGPLSARPGRSTARTRQGSASMNCTPVQGLCQQSLFARGPVALHQHFRTSGARNAGLGFDRLEGDRRDHRGDDQVPGLLLRYGGDYQVSSGRRRRRIGSRRGLS